MRAKVEAVDKEPVDGTFGVDLGNRALHETRANVLRGWRRMSELLAEHSEQELAAARALEKSEKEVA